MSLTNLNFENEIDVRARKALISDLWTRDSEGEFFKVTPGGGGSGDLPYWVKMNKAELGDQSQKAVLDSFGLAVVDNTTNKAAEITASGLTIGDSSGNSVLDKNSVDAANRVKNIAQDMAPTGKKVLLYNATTSGITYGDGTAFLPSYLKTNSVEISGAGTKTSVRDYNIELSNTAAGKGAILGASSLVFLDSLASPVTFTSASADAANKLATGIASSINNTLGDGRSLLSWNSLGNNIIKTMNVKLTKTSNEYSTLEPTKLAVYNTTTATSCAVSPANVTITESGVPSVLTGASIIAANKLATVAKVITPSEAYESIIYNPTTKAFGYTPTNASLTIPAWVKTNSIDSITAGSISISAAKGGVGNIDLDNSLNNSRIRLNGPESSLDIQKTTDGVTENASLTITDVQITNKLKAITRVYTDYNLPSGISNTIQQEVVYNPVSKNFAFRALERAAMNDASYSQNANGGGLVALYRDGTSSDPHNLLQPDTIVAYSAGQTPDMKRFELKNKLLMEFTGLYNTWYCVHFANNVSVEADAGAIKATICPTTRVDTGVTGPAVLYTCLVNSEIPKRDNVLVPKGSFCFKLHNPSIPNMSTRTTTRILFERVCNDFEAIAGVMPTRLARQA
jgi:hypothetical protein